MRKLHIRYCNGSSNLWEISDAVATSLKADMLAPQVIFLEFQGSHDGILEDVLIRKTEISEYQTYIESPS